MLRSDTRAYPLGLSETNGVYIGNETGTNVTRSGVQWFKFRLDSGGTLSYYRHDRIYDSAVTNTLYYYYPSITVNCASDILLGFSGSGSTNYIGAYYVWRPAFGPASDPQSAFTQAVRISIQTGGGITLSPASTRLIQISSGQFRNM